MHRTDLLHGVLRLTAALAAALALAVVVSPRAHAQEAGSLVASGFNGPMGVLAAPDGTLWVVDTGTGGDQETPFLNPVTRQLGTVRYGETSRILKIAPDGTQHVVQTLPSFVITPEESFGGARLAMIGDALYVTAGGWIEGVPTARVEFMASVTRVSETERTEIADLWATEHSLNPDGLIAESHPYGVAVGPDGMLWVADAGANTLLKVHPASGDVQVAAVFGGIESPLPNSNRNGAREADPVPTAVAFDGEGNAYVALLPGFPFLPGSGKVVRVDREGAITDFANGLTMLTDLQTGPDGQLYAVSLGQFTEKGPIPNSGSVVRVTAGASEPVLTGLSFPTGLSFNAAGDAFVTINGVGAPGSGELRRFDRLAAAE